MRIADFCPPSSPSLDQQRDALQKGLGRALQWALAGRLADGPLLEACLSDKRHDAQVEDCRADWLWRIITTIGAAGRFRLPILHALHALSDERDAWQLCGFARRYAEAGDEEFRYRLYGIVEQKPFPDSQRLGEEEIVHLDGEQAFLFATRVRGKLLAHREWEWDDGALVDEASERFGEDRVRGLLDAGDEDIKRFRAAWLVVTRRKGGGERKSEGNLRPSQAARMRSISVDEILATAAQSNRYLSPFRGWGLFADVGDLRAILHHLWSERSAVVIANLLKIFSGRPLPEFDPRLIELCSHSDESVRRWALAALEENEHTLVADFARGQLERGLPDRRALGLFIRNYRDGDERRILDVLDLPDEDCERHWLLMDVIKILERNPAADGSELALIAYASTPCENCRCDAATLLHGRGVAPGWLIAECQFDSSEKCRQMATAALANKAKPT